MPRPFGEVIMFDWFGAGHAGPQHKKQSYYHHDRGGKKTRDLGKWVDGFGGKLTQKYKAWRKMRRKMASRSRAINRQRAK